MSLVIGFDERKEQTPVSGHEALRLELLDGHLGVLWEEKNVPVLVPHGVDGIELFSGKMRRSWMEVEDIRNEQNDASACVSED